MPEDTHEEQDDVEAARVRIWRAVDDAVTAVRDVADPDRAYAAAKLLVNTLRDAVHITGRVHAQAAARLRAEENLSYSALAERLGVTKGRAEQLVRSAAAAADREGTS